MGTARHYPQRFGSTPIAAPISARGRAYIVTAVATFSALTVFLSLCARDHSRLLSVSAHERHMFVQPAAIQRLSDVSADAQPAADSITHVTVPTAVSNQPAATALSALPLAATDQPAASGAVSKDSETAVAKSHSELSALEKRGVWRYFDFSLPRSRRLQRVGPVSVVVWRIDAKHKLYDVVIITDGHRVDRKRVSLNSPVLVASSRFVRPLQFVVRSIDRNGISGYLTEPQAVR